MARNQIIKHHVQLLAKYSDVRVSYVWIFPDHHRDHQVQTDRSYTYLTATLVMEVDDEQTASVGWFLKNGLERIGEFAFRECESLKEVDIPPTVK
eukprot:scaffold11063_cov68-Cylindrotheca_fusiformis.AAC.1